MNDDYERGFRDGQAAAKRNPPKTPLNPKGEPIGHYTGRCGNCGSNNLWDDNMNYGCNNCKSFWCLG